MVVWNINTKYSFIALSDGKVILTKKLLIGHVIDFKYITLMRLANVSNITEKKFPLLVAWNINTKYNSLSDGKVILMKKLLIGWLHVIDFKYITLMRLANVSNITEKKFPLLVAWNINTKYNSLSDGKVILMKKLLIGWLHVIDFKYITLIRLANASIITKKNFRFW